MPGDPGEQGGAGAAEGHQLKRHFDVREFFTFILLLFYIFYYINSIYNMSNDGTYLGHFISYDKDLVIWTT